MEVTDVRLFKSKKEGMVKAFGKATIDDQLVLDVIVMDKGDGKGAWASFPNGKTGQDGKFYLPVYFKDKDKDSAFKTKVLEAYGRLGSSGGSSPTNTGAQRAAAAAQDFTADDMPF